MKSAVKNWLPLAILVTGVCALVYGTLQQSFRQSLNDPQIQMAEDAAFALEKGALAADVIPRGASIDIAGSLAPWIALYDEEKVPLESTGVLNNAPPKPPMGVFNAAKANESGYYSMRGYHVTGENRVSWQPERNVRAAIVVVHVNGGSGGYVVAGRNMRETEMRIIDLAHQILIAWIVLLLATFAAQWLFIRPSRHA
jgi:hypothetical protein